MLMTTAGVWWVWWGLFACLVAVVACVFAAQRRSIRGAWTDAQQWQAKALDCDTRALGFARQAVDAKRELNRVTALALELRARAAVVLDGDPRDAQHTAARVELRRAVDVLDEYFVEVAARATTDATQTKGTTHDG